MEGHSNSIIRVGIAEDQRLFRECIVPILNAYENFRVVLEAENGRQFVEKLAHLPENEHPDVVLLDLAMPEMNGLETTQFLKKEYPNIKILILSVHSEERHIVKMVNIGVNGYLLKNSEISEVCQAVRNVYDKGFYFNESVMRAMQVGMSQKQQKQYSIENPLTAREKEVLELICKELTTPEIAEKLFLSVRTVDGHRNSLLEKTKARNTAGLVLYAMKNGLVDYGF